MVKLGIIGCGRVTETVHMPVLRHMPDVQVVAACDIREDRLRLVQQAFEIPYIYRDWVRLIENKHVDAVLVATPSDSHPLLASAALEGEKHVLVEKPFALTVADAEALAKQARQARVVSMVGFNYRFHPLARALKATLEQGCIGRPLAAFTTFMTSADQSTSITDYKRILARGGGVFHDKATHNLDVIRYLFDSEIRTGAATSLSEVHDQDFATIVLQLANGVQVTGSFCDRGLPDHSYIVFGDEGKAIVNLSRPTGVLLYRKEFSRTRAKKIWSYARQAPRVVASTLRLATRRGRLRSYHNQWQTFFGCIATGSQARPNFEDGLAVTRAVSDLIGSVSCSQGNGESEREVGLFRRTASDIK